MDYVFRQHYNFQPPSVPSPAFSAVPIVLLVETEPEALALYARHLASANLLVNVCLDLDQLLRQIGEIQPHLLVINPAPDLAATIVSLRQVSSDHPGLPIITVGAPIPDPYLDRLMASGVALHINRTLSQPRDIAVAARQILGLA